MKSVLFKCIAFSLLLIWVIPAFVMSFFDVQGEEHQIAQSTTEQFAQTTIRENRILLLQDETVAELSWEDYLTGVLLCEMPGSFCMEAKKAQAVVARTYAMKLLESGYKHGAAIICSDPNCCQGYIAPDAYLKSYPDAFSVEEARQAVKETEGVVITYDGALIDATYFSCSGGKTEDAVAVWGMDVPYLQAVLSPGEEKAAVFTDTVRFSADQFEAVLDRDLPGTPDSWFGPVSYTQGGGVDTIEIVQKLYTGTDLRMKLGLRSTAFSITAIGDSILITTKGFGHRVGMSQYGAQAMAETGADYVTILMHYYQGVEITSGY